MLHFSQAIINSTTMSATQFNTLSGASKKMHMYAVHVLIHLHSKGFLPEDFKPIDLDTTLVDSFDQDAIKAEFKKLTKKTKATKIVSSPREDVVSAIATTFYENKNTDISTNPISEKPKRKYNRKPKAADADATVNADTNDTVPAVVNDIVADIVQAAQSDVVKEKKKRAPKKAVTPPTADAPAADVTADAPAPDAPQVKEKKPRTKKVPTPPTSDVQEQPVEIQPAPEVKEKKSRAKKVPTPSTSDVQEQPVETQPVSEVKETKEKKEKKSRAKKVEVPSTPPLPPTQELVSEPSIVDNNDQDQDQDQDDSEEIQARILIYQDKEYLVDAEGTVYDKVSFDEIGIFQNDIINFN